jgi:molybdate transport system substrate-binding protein
VRRALPLLALLLVAAGCGDGASEPAALTVSAAASLRTALPEYAAPYDARLSFAGSDELAAQIRRGVRPDVFASADADLIAALHDEGLVEKPVAFASNELVVAVPPRSPVGSLEDLANEGVRIAIGARNVPVGRFARAVIDELDPAVAANVRTEEPNVTGVVAKLLAGAADAGFVYRTDVLAQPGRLRDLRFEDPALIGLAAAVVRGTENPEEARRFVTGLRDAPELATAGFGPPP